MPTNFTPLPKTVASGKDGANLNMVLIIIALVITILLGALMWFLVVQRQQEEDRTSLPANNRTPRTIEATVEPAGQSPLDGAVASPSSTIKP